MKEINCSYKAIPTYPRIHNASELDWEEFKRDFQELMSDCINDNAAAIRTKFYQKPNLIRTLLHCDVQDVHTKYRAIDFAVVKGSLEVVQCLLEFGANPDSNEYSKKCFSALELAIVHKQERIVKYLIEYGVNLQNSLYLALKHDQIGTFKILLTNKSNPDFLSEEGFNVLHLAVKKNKMELVKLLIEYGADPNVKSKLRGRGRSALHFAAEEQNCDMIEYLIHPG